MPNIVISHFESKEGKEVLCVQLVCWQSRHNEVSKMHRYIIYIYVYQTRLQPNLVKKGWDIVLREGVKKKCEKRSG